mgnify:CR=1 FL=1
MDGHRDHDSAGGRGRMASGIRSEHGNRDMDMHAGIVRRGLAGSIAISALTAVGTTTTAANADLIENIALTAELTAYWGEHTEDFKLLEGNGFGTFADGVSASYSSDWEEDDFLGGSYETFASGSLAANLSDSRFSLSGFTSAYYIYDGDDPFFFDPDGVFGALDNSTISMTLAFDLTEQTSIDSFLLPTYGTYEFRRSDGTSVIDDLVLEAGRYEIDAYINAYPGPGGFDDYSEFVWTIDFAAVPAPGAFALLGFGALTRRRRG